MTFDEMIEKLLNNENYNTDGLSVDDVITLIEVLRLEYAQTVKMTSGNKATFDEVGESLTKLLTDYYGFDILYWGDITERQLAQAWLHPETIKIVDE